MGLKVVKVRKGHGHGFKKKLVVDNYVPSKTIIEVEEKKIEIVEVDEPKIEPTKEVTTTAVATKAKSKSKK